MVTDVGDSSSITRSSAWMDPTPPSFGFGFLLLYEVFRLFRVAPGFREAAVFE